MKSVLLAAAVLLSAGVAHATTYDFTGNICNGGMACSGGFGNTLDQSYGDTAGANVVYDGDVTAAGIQNVNHWGTGYEGFAGAIWNSSVVGLSVSILANPGYTVTLSSVGIAPLWP